MLNKIRFVDSFTLKVIAMITMVIDHIGYFLFPKYLVLRYIGRLSFVLFAFQTVESMKYSKHKERYILVLLLFEIVMSLGQMIVTHEYTSTIFIILALGVLTIYFLEKKKWYLKVLALIPLSITFIVNSRIIDYKIDFSIYGYILILLYYFIRRFTEVYFRVANNEGFKEKYFYIFYTILASLGLLCLNTVCYIYNSELTLWFPKNGNIYYNQVYSSYAIIVILLYNGNKGYSPKWFRVFCYLFYPVHIMVINLIAYLF